MGIFYEIMPAVNSKWYSQLRFARNMLQLWESKKGIPNLKNDVIDPLITSFFARSLQILNKIYLRSSKQKTGIIFLNLDGVGKLQQKTITNYPK